jgi:hypothetical protein
LVFDFETVDHLEALTVYVSILDPDTTYYWRVMFFDSNNGPSLWADAFSFKTQSGTASGDDDGDGVPEDQEVADGTVDLDDDGNNDTFSNTYKAVNTLIGNAVVGVKASTNVISVDALKSVDPNTISDTSGKPDDLLIGLIDFKVTVSAPGVDAQVTVYLSEAAPAGATWWKYSLINGWQDYSANVTFSTDRKSATLNLTDGGKGDADGLANGTIVDPSGPGGVVTTSGLTAEGGGSGCFIATAAFGSKFKKHVRILQQFRDVYLLPYKTGRALIDVYYKHSPPVAGFIEKHDFARGAARLSLLPLVGMSWCALYLGVIPSAFLFILFGILAITVARKTVMALGKPVG